MSKNNTQIEAIESTTNLEYFGSLHKHCIHWYGNKFDLVMEGLNRYVINFKKAAKTANAQLEGTKLRSLGTKYIITVERDENELVVVVKQGKRKTVLMEAHSLTKTLKGETKVLSEKEIGVKAEKVAEDTVIKLGEIALERLELSYRETCKQAAKEVTLLLKKNDYKPVLMTSLFEEVYHMCEGVSKSSLIPLIQDTLDHYNENKKRVLSSDAVCLGRAFHCKLLTPELYKKQLSVSPNIDLRSKEGKAKMMNWRFQNIGKTIINEDENFTVSNYAKKIKEHPILSKFLAEGLKEVSFFKRDEKTGLLLRGRADQIITDPSDELVKHIKKYMPTYNGEIIIIDYKTFRKSLSVKNIEKEKYDRLYPVQAAQYTEIIEEIYGRKAIFLYGFVEKKAPFSVRAVFECDASLDWGLEKRNQALEQLANYEKNPDMWTGYDLEITRTGIPHWAINNFED